MSAPRRAMKLLKDQELRGPNSGGKREQSKRVSARRAREGHAGGLRVQNAEGGGEEVAEILHSWPSTQLLQGMRGSIDL